MRLVSLLVITSAFAATALAQSARIKPTVTPTPNRIDGPSARSTPAPAKTPSQTSDPAPTAKVHSDDKIIIDSVLIPIPVSVVDGAGRPLLNLKANDFDLVVDGKPAAIGDLARSESPIRLAMLFDNSSSVLIARDFEKEAAVRFFQRVIRPDKDLAALFSMADYTRLEESFTSDVSRLTRAIDLFPIPQGATALLDGIIKATDYLRSADGRRVLVIVSDGEDTYSDVKTTLEAVIKTLQLADCQVYVVKTKDFENFKRTGVRGGNANIRALTAERRMMEITQQTGGSVYSPIDEREMNDAFDRISAELSQQYILSYYPDEEATKDGDFRSITVNVKNRQNLTIRARKGYYVGRR